MKSELTAYNQEQVYRFYEELDDTGKATLDEQLDDIDWEQLNALVENYVKQKPEYHTPDDLQPAPYYPLKPETAEQKAYYEKAKATGEALLKEGKVACFTVAGGQGTRLGYDGPKGSFNLSPIKQKSLFQLFAESILRHGKRYGKDIKWYIMTSPGNDAATRAFFAEHDNFGLKADQLMFFKQGQMPAFDRDGNMLLSAKDSLALSPDGHGGSLRALHRSGALADMAANGIDYISYFQVDNPLVSTIDPLFIGLHHLDKAEMSNRMLAKREPFEKLGLFCVSKGKIQVIEYSDLPDELAVLTNDDGRLQFIAGSPAIHIISRSFVEKLNEGTFSLPFHRADKKVPYINQDGERIEPQEPNAVKLETFVFDALPLARGFTRAAHGRPNRPRAGADPNTSATPG